MGGLDNLYNLILLLSAEHKGCHIYAAQMFFQKIHNKPLQEVGYCKSIGM